MFESVLKPSGAPKRRFGTGTAFAVAFHAWLLVAAIAQTAPHKAHASQEAPTIVLAAQASPPPLLGNGGGGPPKPAKRAPKRQATPNPFKNPPPEPQPTTTPPETEAPAADSAPAGDQGGGGGGDGPGNGGDPNGDPNGVPGGTGTAAVKAPPPPIIETIYIGDPALDQTTCEISGKPPYPKEALAQKIEGTVITRCTVEPDGALSGCGLIKTLYSFDKPVMEFLSKARARPFTARGKPARVPCVFKFTYKLAP